MKDHRATSSTHATESVVSNCLGNETVGNDATTVDTKSGARSSFGNYTPRQWPQLGNCPAFVRVRKRALKGGHPYWREYRRRQGTLNTGSMSFDLVQAVRINGKPRQKFLLGLGSIKARYEREYELVHFWLAVVSHLTRSGIDSDRRRLIIKQMVMKGARLPSAAACEGHHPFSWQSDAADEFRAMLSKLSEAAQ